MARIQSNLLHLKECECRFNHRHEDFCRALLAMLRVHPHSGAFACLEAVARVRFAIPLVKSLCRRGRLRRSKPLRITTFLQDVLWIFQRDEYPQGRVLVRCALVIGGGDAQADPVSRFGGPALGCGALVPDPAVHGGLPFGIGFTVDRRMRKYRRPVLHELLPQGLFLRQAPGVARVRITCHQATDQSWPHPRAVRGQADRCPGRRAWRVAGYGRSRAQTGHATVDACPPRRPRHCKRLPGL